MELWIVEVKDGDEWVPHEGYLPIRSKEGAEEFARSCRFDLVPDSLRIAKYVRQQD